MVMHKDIFFDAIKKFMPECELKLVLQPRTLIAKCGLICQLFVVP